MAASRAKKSPSASSRNRKTKAKPGTRSRASSSSRSSSRSKAGKAKKTTIARAKTTKSSKGTTARTPRAVRERPDGPYVLHEALTLVLMGLSAMLFLALVSYTPADLPAWVPFSSQSGDSEEVRNFIGPVGAVVAGYTYFFFGAASYLFPAVLAWWTFQVLTGARPFHGRNFLALVLLVGSAACLVEYQTAFFQDWPARYNLANSAGGLFGFGVGNKMIERAMGPVGGLIVAAIVYVIALIVITGIHPFHFAMLVKKECAGAWDRFFEYREIASEERRDALRAGKKSPASRSSAARKKAEPKSKAKASPPDPDPEEIAPELPFGPPTPDRKIIDSAQRKNNKLSREEAAASLFPDGKKSSGDDVLLTGGQFGDYQLPPLSLLDSVEDEDTETVDEDTLIGQQNNIIDTLGTFGVDVEAGDITRGPTITRFELYPAPGLRVNRITALQPDIARATRAERINILAPVPGKDTVGIEIANSDKVPVVLRELFEDEAFRDTNAKLPLALGKDVYGRTIVGDLARMPHLLVAGATGSGKSVCINGIIASLLYRFTPDELRFIMIDPKVVEMQLYNDLPHMVVPVVTDPKKVLLALRWVINEMERRYALFAKKGTRNFDGYNALRAREIAAEKEGREAVADEGENPDLAADQDPAASSAAMPAPVDDGPGGEDEAAAANRQRRQRHGAPLGRMDTVDEESEWADLPDYGEELDTGEEFPPPLDGPGTESDAVPAGFSTQHVKIEDSDPGGGLANSGTGLPGDEFQALRDGDILGGGANGNDPDDGFAGGFDEPRGDDSSLGADIDEEELPDSLPYIVVIIDELADLMQTAPADVETGIARIAQKARAAGIHLIVATQTPRADVVTGIIKANIPSRIAFQVSSKTDSRIILDNNGAENLVGKGDMLYLPPGTASTIRAQGALITDEEAQRLVEACAEQASPKFEPTAQEQIEKGEGFEEDEEISDADEDLVEKCLEVVFQEKKASTSLLQRRLRLGYTRAARMMDILESRGIIGAGEGAKPREILVDLSDDLG